MQAIQLTRFGGPEVLRATELPDPIPAAGQVLVRVEAAGINFAEALMRENRYAMTPPLPSVPGVEAVGRIAALGPGVSGLSPGQRVAAPLFAAGAHSGGYAEQLVIDARWALPLPEALAADQACALMAQGLTALALTRQRPVQGQRVLVTAAAGGVGTLALQLLRYAGARQVIAAASTEAKRTHALLRGADAVVDYTQPGWPQTLQALTDGAGPDVVFDSVGGEITMQALEALGSGGRMVLYGGLNIQSFALGVPQLLGMIFRNQTLGGFALAPQLTPEGLRRDLLMLAGMALTSELVVDIAGRYPLAEAARAHRDLAGRQTIGKLVLLP